MNEMNERFIVKFVVESEGYKVWDTAWRVFASGSYTLQSDAQAVADRKNANPATPAPAPVDILAAKNERIAALEKGINKAIAMLEYVTLHSSHAAQLVLKKALAGEEFSSITIAPLEQAPLAAPVQEAVTLTTEEIEWLAEHEIPTGVQRGKFCVSFTGAIQTWTFTTRILERVYIHTSEENQYDEWYVLKPEFDKRENRAAIASRRKELGLGE
jgi:hypothetical protein